MKKALLLIGCCFVLSVMCGKEGVDPLITFDFKEPTVVLNPTGVAPLCAVATYTSDAQGKTKIIVKGRHGPNSDIEHTFNDYGLIHRVIIAGLYIDYDNTVVLSTVDSRGNVITDTTIHIQTGPLSDGLPASIDVNVAQNDTMGNGLNLVSNHVNVPSKPLFIDRYGDIRWVLDYTGHSELGSMKYDCGITRLRNGNFFFGDKASNKIYEVDMLGNILNRWELSGYAFHHNVQEKPDGNLLLTASSSESMHLDGTAATNDFVIELDRAAGNIARAWDLKVSLDEYRKALSTNAVDWFHGNAVIYDSSDNTIIVSGRVQGVVKLTYDNKVKWILGPHKGWGTNRSNEDLNRYLLTPLDAGGNAIIDTNVVIGNADHPDFEWNWYQHSPRIMPNGHLLLFDNGSVRNYYFENPVHYSRAVEYAIDEAAMTVRQVWSYGKERGAETYSSIISSVQYLPETGHILFCPGYKVANANGMGGKIVEIDYLIKKVVFEMSICSQSGWAFHRAERATLYP